MVVAKAPKDCCEAARDDAVDGDGQRNPAATAEATMTTQRMGAMDDREQSRQHQALHSQG